MHPTALLNPNPNVLLQGMLGMHSKSMVKKRRSILIKRYANGMPVVLYIHCHRIIVPAVA